MTTSTLTPEARAPRALPRPVWLGLSLLCLLGAGAAGAFIMKDSLPASPAAVQAPQPSTATQAPLALAAPTAGVTPRAAAPARHRRGETADRAQSRPGSEIATTRAALPVCADCGVVESVRAYQTPGQGTGAGAVAGGVLGAVVGHQLGGGNGKAALTLLGAVGGGVAGNEVEKRMRSQTYYQVRVRMDDGRVRSFDRREALAVGARVVVDGRGLHLAREAAPAAAPTQPRLLNTSTSTAAAG